MRILICLLSFYLGISSGYSQLQKPDARLSPLQLREDLSYLKRLISNVHVYPNSELSPLQYELLFKNIENSINDSANATQFLKKIKPIIAYLSDEHAQVNLIDNLLSGQYRDESVYVPFALKQENGNYVIDHCFGKNCDVLKKQSVLAVNGTPIKDLLQKCALATTGFPGQRENAAMSEFGYLYPWATSKLKTQFLIRTKNGKTLTVGGVNLKTWKDHLAGHSDLSVCDDRLSYRKIGNIGYIKACSFDIKPAGKYSLDSIKIRIDDIFKQIKRDGVVKLVIDVSQNEGGNSAVGDYLINYIHGKSYMSYQTNWKRSDEYLQLLRSWGIENPDYVAEPVGKVLTFASSRISQPPVLNPFVGEKVVVIGKRTFSSALTFATLIRDNKIAQLVGQTPVNGHPNGFGEMYYTNLPHSKVFIRFGVKEYVRPAGKTGKNILPPDLLLTDSQMKNVDELLKNIRF